MNVHPDAVFTTILCNTREAIPYSMDFVSFELEAVHLQMEEIKKDIQDATNSYIINIPSPNTNLLDTDDNTIKYIQALIQDHHSYPGPLTAPIIQVYSPASR